MKYLRHILVCRMIQNQRPLIQRRMGFLCTVCPKCGYVEYATGPKDS